MTKTSGVVKVPTRTSHHAKVFVPTLNLPTGCAEGRAASIRSLLAVRPFANDQPPALADEHAPAYDEDALPDLPLLPDLCARYVRSNSSRD
ncbi:hypothetical protein [Streptomyces sp. NPDC052496]|uniref:hypothetical protein n=1 Tax=Streptomyces sp. NPDC052496 TaxID=3154951 RepID=UPI003436C572